MYTVEVDIDRVKMMSSTQAERTEFMAGLMSVCSRATAEFGAHVDFSDSFHWVIQIPDDKYQPCMALLMPALAKS